MMDFTSFQPYAKELADDIGALATEIQQLAAKEEVAPIITVAACAVVMAANAVATNSDRMLLCGIDVLIQQWKAMTGGEGIKHDA